MALVKEPPMPDHLAAAIRSLPGDNTGHSMTGTSPGTGPDTGPWYRSPGTGPVTSRGTDHRGRPVRSISHRGLVRSSVHCTGHRGPVRSPVHDTDHRGPVRSPVFYQQ
ncbi:hypothetical protein DPMN_105461 [Dreissena polymorpha]|uniref:Uncharacterized protein n=1 Tax=Dreissena polymorpha TaxID=45954 RepID=A0A9D4HDU8_DREPO|nr:hypothetical protein DPMN_105461 [Dreissena polymorpha]